MCVWKTKRPSGTHEFNPDIYDKRFSTSVYVFEGNTTLVWIYIDYQHQINYHDVGDKYFIWANEALIIDLRTLI